MQAESTIRPPVPLEFLIEKIEKGKCNIHFYENIEKVTNTDGDIIYKYDEYILNDIPYYEKLKTNIEANKNKWLEIAKEKEKEEPEYDNIQIIQQEITDLMIENIEQGQQMTDIELLLLGGNDNV